MHTKAKFRFACEHLVDCRRRGILTDLPQELSPASRAEGYAIQACLPEITEDRQLGWKIAATSAAGQAHINVDGPIVGRIMFGSVFKSGDSLHLDTNNMRVVELEFAFCLGKDIPPRTEPYTELEVLDCVSSLHPAMELPNSCYENVTTAGAPKFIADNAAAGQFIFGPALYPGWRDMDLAAYTVSATVLGKAEFQGTGANVLGDPRAALAWMVNELSSHGIPLVKGHMVSTGTCMAPINVVPGDSVIGDFGILGQLHVHVR